MSSRFALLLSALALAACTDESGPELPEGAQVFAYGLDPAQSISAAPFPNDIYRSADGVALAPLGGDAVYGALADAAVLARFDELIAGRPGFGFAAPIRLPANTMVDLASVSERASLVALDGPEAGRAVALELFWSPLDSSLAFFPAPGDYLMPDTSYVLALDAGVTTAGGEAIGAPAELATALAAEPPGGSAAVGWERLAPLRAWLEARGGVGPVVATTFRTEPSLPPLEAVLDAVAAFTLEAPSRDLAWDPTAEAAVAGPAHEGAALDDYFGVPEAPFATNPGSWDDGARERAAEVSGAPYEGGTFRGRIGKVVHGSVLVPAFNVSDDGGSATPSALAIEDGVAGHTLLARVPVTLYLCEQHLADASAIPLAIFTHGGTATRNNATPLAVMNCELGVATLGHDLPFHGGRSDTTIVGGVVEPTRADLENELTGLKFGDAGFVPDGVGDAAGGAETVGELFAINQTLDPLLIEANLLAVPGELATLTRVAVEGDWSAFHEGLSFDVGALFHQSLSFGSSFTTGQNALSDAYLGVIGSTASGHIFAANLTVAPSNAELAGGIIKSLLELESAEEEIAAGVYRDPVGGLHAWLAERGDPIAFAPYLLRHRPSGSARSIVHSGDSWDPTLSSAAQLRYNAAVGFEVLASDGWQIDATVPGAATLAPTTIDGSVSGNVEHGGVTHSAAIFYNEASCHAQLIVPICTKSYESEYPPVVPLAAEDVTVTVSPICALHAQAMTLMQSLLDGAPLGEIVAPSGDCDAVYGR